MVVGGRRRILAWRRGPTGALDSLLACLYFQATLQSAVFEKAAWADSSSPFFLLERFSLLKKPRNPLQKVDDPVSWQASVERTVTGLGYELVDTERTSSAGGGLLRVYIDRVAGDPNGEFITVEDCEKVTRQLQHVLEVENCAYARLEISSPGLDRPLKKAADYARFAGEQIDLTLKLAFQGRKKYSGVLQARPDGEGAGWRIVFNDGKTDQALDFSLDEVREARLVPVVDFKGKRFAPVKPAAEQAVPGQEVDGGRER